MELPNRAEHDSQAAAVLAKLYGQHRRELEGILAHDPDIANVPAEFWERVRRETEEDVAALLFLVFLASATLHGSGSTPRSGGSAAGEAVDAALRWSGQQARLRAHDQVTGSRELLQRAMMEWQAQRAAGNPVTGAEIGERLVTIFGPNRAAREALDMVTTAQTAGGEWLMAHVGLLSAQDEWKTNPHLSKSGPCEICEPLNGTVRELWERVAPTGPPVHKRCVCEITYAAMKGEN